MSGLINAVPGIKTKAGTNIKKTFLLRSAAMMLAILMLAGYGAGGSSATAASETPEPAPTAHIMPPSTQEVPAGHSITERSYTTYINDADTTLTDPFPLYFMDGVDDLPYVELHSWAELMCFLAHEEQGDPGFELSIEEQGEKVIFERETGYTMEFDFRNDVLFFDDYDAYVHISADTALLDMVSESGFNAEGEASLFRRDRQNSFDRYGDVMSVNLGDYGIHLVAQDGKYYAPLQTMNDLLISPPMGKSLLFNGQALFFADDDALFDYKERDYTDLAWIYYDAPTGDRSDALAEYSYNELCLALDTLYGLKEPHDIRSFHQFFWEIGYDEPLSGNSAHDADVALKSFIDYYLDDLHSVFNEYSYLAGLDAISGSSGTSNRNYDRHAVEYYRARMEFYPEGCPFYEEVGNTAYITFDSFNSWYTGEAFYDAREKDEELDDTIALIIYAHSQIMREGSPIENVVLDLSNNSGGAVDAAVFVLGWILGDAPLSVKNMYTGAVSTAIYRVDTNLDRQFDEQDTLEGKNVYCLISPVSFSCGNSVPAALKASQEVTLLGRTSGGGSCIV